MKREILTFTNKISEHLSKPEKKFTADITYGMLASGSCLLTEVADQLHEPSQKINIVDRLSRHLEKGTPTVAAASYLQLIKKWIPSDPVIHIDDSDVVKPDGYQFESLGIVRDGSESTSTKNVYKKCLQKMFTKRAIMLQRLVYLQAVIKVSRTYFSRWKIEEYFCCKKQMFQFENFRVRKLKAINALNFYITLCMAFLAHISMKSEIHALKVAIIQTADPIKEKVYFSQSPAPVGVIKVSLIRTLLFKIIQKFSRLVL